MSADRPEWLIEKCWTPRLSPKPRTQFARADVLALLNRLREVRAQAAHELSRAERQLLLASSQLLAAGQRQLERRKLPDTRDSRTCTIRLTHNVGEFVTTTDCYLTVGLYPDGTPGELFLRVPSDPTLSGFADGVAMMASLALQHGASIEVVAGKLRHQRFEPSGRTADGAFASSLLDAVAVVLQKMFPANP